MTTGGRHDDGSKGISAYINDPKKNLRNAHIINKSYIVHRQTHFLMRLPCDLPLCTRVPRKFSPGSFNLFLMRFP